MDKFKFALFLIALEYLRIIIFILLGGDRAQAEDAAESLTRQEKILVEKINRIIKESQ